MRSFAPASAPAASLLLTGLALAVLFQAPLGHAQTRSTPDAPAFHHVDADGDGRVTLAEVMAYAKQQREHPKPFALKDVDADGDGLITQEELSRVGIKGLEGFGTISAKELDRNGDGYVSHEDLENYLNTKHREAYSLADQDKDGSLKPSEFVLFRFR